MESQPPPDSPVPRLTLRAIRRPAAPSKRIMPILLATEIGTARVSPIAILPVTSTSAAVYGDGGTKKSPVLVARPLGVLTAMWPEVADAGTRALIVVAVAELTAPRYPLKDTLLPPLAVSKLVPVIVTAEPAVPTVGVKPLMVGAVPGPTVNGVALTALPAGEVTRIGPVVAPAGTTATNWFSVADTTVADTPLKVTAFWAAVA